MTTPAPTGPDIKTVATQLAREAKSIVQDLLPGGTVMGREYRCHGPEGGKGSALRVILEGPKAGSWTYFPDGGTAYGDLLNLYSWTHSGSTRARAADAYKWGCARLGYGTGRGRAAARPSRKVQRQMQAEEAARLAKAEEEASVKRIKAQEIWRASRPGAGTLAEAYLRGRGLGGYLDRNGWPACLRFHPAQFNPIGKVRLPCMVTALTVPGKGLDGRYKTIVQAVQRTYIVPRDWSAHGLDVRTMTPAAIMDLGADVPVIKAPVRDLASPAEIARLIEDARAAGLPLDLDKHFKRAAKLHKASPMGAAAWIKPTAGRTVLAMGEGLENTLSAEGLLPGAQDWALWCPTSAAGLSRVIIPRNIEKLVLLGDGDSGAITRWGKTTIPADDAMRRTAQLHADAAAADGRDLAVEIRWAPDGTDWNNVIQQQVRKVA